MAADKRLFSSVATVSMNGSTGFMMGSVTDGIIVNERSAIMLIDESMSS